MFYRIKKIKGIEYAYLVNNKWTKHGVRQKVGKYLGKVIRLQRITNNILPKLPEFSTLSPSVMIDNLVNIELIQHGFVEQNGRLLFGQTEFYHRKISNNHVFLMNDGFFCNYSIKQIYDFDFMGDETETGSALASILLNAGISISQENFIILFNKIYKPNQASKL
jgi:hypothetical protein